MSYSGYRDLFFFALAMDRDVLRSNILPLEESLLRSSRIDPLLERSRIKAYRLAYKLAIEVFHKAKSFPNDEKYSLTDQMRRASRSIPANLAEAWRKRIYSKMFISKLIDCAGEASEMEVWLDFSKDTGYLDQQEYDYFFRSYGEVNRMLNGMIDKSHKFCSNES